jgi:DNA (cytosine-5)-methyltransferase 1
MIRQQFSLDVNDEMIVDNFAGGGGASTGIEQALGRHVDVAVNHDPQAVALHSANHPQTRHFCEDVFKVNPEAVTMGRRVGLAWFSPDCKHFSKAKGGKPRSKKIRGLAWVVIKWAARVAPRVIVLENVEEFQKWGPLLPGGQPCPKRQGATFRNFVGRLEGLGYRVEWRELRACDYGTPTIRKRLFLIARRDGKPIVWPQPTHADPASAGFKASGLQPWRTAAECIDWSLPCHSIFLTKEEARALGIKRPLAEATMRRLGRGTWKFVINAAEPFIVPLTHQGSDRVEAVTQPFKTMTGAHRGEKALAVPFLTEHANGTTQRIFDPQKPLRTQCAEVKGGHFALASAFLAKHYSGVVGSEPGKPIGTVTSVDHHSMVAASMAKFRFDSHGSDAGKPLPTITAGSFVKRPGGAGHALGLVASHLSKFYGTNTGQRTGEPLHSVTSQGNHIAEVRAFLIKYYGNEKDGIDLRVPMHTIPTLDRFGLVTVCGELFQISDIGMRMLVARELYRAQGFLDSYVIEIEIEAVRHGKLKRVPLSGEAQVRMCGNSVCPPLARAIVAANVPEMAVWRNGERKAFQKMIRRIAPPQTAMVQAV